MHVIRDGFDVTAFRTARARMYFILAWMFAQRREWHRFARVRARGLHVAVCARDVCRVRDMRSDGGLVARVASSSVSIVSTGAVSAYIHLGGWYSFFCGFVYILFSIVAYIEADWTTPKVSEITRLNKCSANCFGGITSSVRRLTSRKCKHLKISIWLRRLRATIMRHDPSRIIATKRSRRSRANHDQARRFRRKTFGVWNVYMISHSSRGFIHPTAT